MSGGVLRSRVAVVGVGTTRFGRLEGFSVADLGAWALREALWDSGLPKEAIDGLIVTRIADNAGFAEATGLTPDYSLVMPPMGRMAGVAIEAACLAIAAGRARRVALVYGNDGRSAGTVYGGAGNLPGTYGEAALPAAAGMTSPGALHALMWSRYMARHGAERRHLAEIAVAFRGHAARNPGAVMRTPITPRDHADARPIVAPLHLLDYCLVNDGGVALILSDAALLDGHGPQPVFLRGCAHASDFRAASFPPDDDWRGAMGRATAASFAEAGVGCADMSGLMIYDNFSPVVLFALEGSGYCEPGTAWRTVGDGRLRLGGRWPTNTSGGHLSESYMQGWALHVEAVRQIRGQAEGRQIGAAELIHVMTAAPQCSSLVWGAEP